MLPHFHFSIERWRKNTEYGVWVSTQGRIRLIRNKSYLEPRINGNGYCYVFTDKGPQAVHRLVAYTWLGDKREATYTVDHINSNKRDNSIKNLRWISEENNQGYAQFKTVPQKSTPKESEKTEHVIENESLQFATLFNDRLDEKTRGRTALALWKAHKIDIRGDTINFRDVDDMNSKKNKLAQGIELEKFLGRIMKVANRYKTYCNHFWYVKEIK